jgi:hypothetical protein
MEFYRPTLDEILDGRELTSAEVRLLACCRTGERAIFGFTVPDEPSDVNEIDAALIRYLLLGGCEAHPPHPNGVIIGGGYISGELNFEGCKTVLKLDCQRCKFSDEPNFMDSEVGHLNLSGSDVPGFNGHRMRVERGVLFSGKFNARGRVDLSTANIGGTLDCIAGVFDGEGLDALNCNAIHVGASVFLRDGFKAIGSVNLFRAVIEGQLSCNGGKFDGGGQDALVCSAIQVRADVFLRDGFKAIGSVNFINAKIENNLTFSGSEIAGDVVAAGMFVGREFCWRGITGKLPTLILNDAQVGVLADDVDSWKSVSVLSLKGFKYGGIDNQLSDFPLSERLDWVRSSWCDELKQSALDKATGFVGKYKERFEPQPYVQLAKFLDDDGHRSAATRVRERMEWRLRRSEYRRITFAADGDVKAGLRATWACFLRVFDLAFGVVFGYGHRPLRGLIFALVLVCFTSLFYGLVYDRGQFAPNSDIILTSTDWRAFADDPEIANPAAAWSASKAGTDYESFSAIGYGIDLFLPLDALGQERAWAPSKDRGNWGYAGFYLRWVIQFLGWVFTGVLAAALTGIIGRKE